MFDRGDASVLKQSVKVRRMLGEARLHITEVTVSFCISTFTQFALCSQKWAVFTHAHRARLMDAVWVGEVSCCFQVSTFCSLLIAKSNGQ